MFPTNLCERVDEVAQRRAVLVVPIAVVGGRRGGRGELAQHLAMAARASRQELSPLSHWERNCHFLAEERVARHPQQRRGELVVQLARRRRPRPSL